ncbi:MAG: S1C family serine protease [Nocardioidaceae bacterium]
MTEQNPHHEQEPGPQEPQPGPGSTYSYPYHGGYQGAYPTAPQQPGPFGFQSAGDQGSHAPRQRGKGFVAGVLVAALAVGGVAGIFGAAGFTAVDHLVANNGTAGPGVGSTVVKTKSAPALDGSVEHVASTVLPSVVKINVRGSQEAGSGSGIIISSNGEILTNNHVAAVAGRHGSITVNFNDGSSAPATVVGTDPVTDLAVIRAHGVSGLQPATIDTSQNLAVGENVVAIGSPFGLEATVTSGIVSALNRPVSVGGATGAGTDTTYPAIQTDAAINPGNSGGPLVNMNGQVIGIDSSIRTATNSTFGQSQGGSIGLGFAIPISKVWPVVQQLRSGQTPTHARLGVTVSDASSNNGLLTGAGIQSVNAGSAAQQAGLRKGDVVTKVDNEVITGSESLVATIRGERPGDKVTLTYVRNGQTHTTSATLDSDAGSAAS